MNAYDAAVRIADCFEQDGVPYAVGGALALMAWGVPRPTKDVDISAFTKREELPRVVDSLERAGVNVNREDAARGVERAGLFKGRLGVFLVDVFLSEHPQYDEMARRARGVVGPDGRRLVYISAEDLALHKLLFGRDKDLDDLQNLLAVRSGFDFEYVRGWLVQMTPPADRRIDMLDDLERRFGSP